MSAYIIRRLLWGIPTILGAVTVLFFVMYMLPGDPVLVILGEEGVPDPKHVELIRAKLGLDRPLYEQYFSWLWNMARLDMGKSFWSGAPVTEEIGLRLPVSLQMMGMAFVMGILVAVPVGIISALRQDSFVDYFFRGFAIAGITIPNFVVGVALLLFLIMAFRWTPPLEYANMFTNPWLSTQQLILPAITLGFRNAGMSARMIRSTLLEVLREDYIRTARAKGLSMRMVVWRHALKNALLPVITLMAVEVIWLVSGSVIIERIFNVPGMGRFLVDSMIMMDYTGMQGVATLMVLATVGVNILVDVAYAWLDPRIRYD